MEIMIGKMIAFVIFLWGVCRLLANRKKQYHGGQRNDSKRKV